jgi:hypothetical protein
MHKSAIVNQSTHLINNHGDFVMITLLQITVLAICLTAFQVCGF